MLHEWIGKICHIYLDDIIIWSNTLEEHHENVCIILTALREAGLYCNPWKTHLFQLEIDFLGHHVSAQGIEADSKKTDHISQWPQLRSAKEVHQFLKLVQYVSSFLPHITEHTRILTELTLKECNKAFLDWEDKHELAFSSIKNTMPVILNLELCSLSESLGSLRDRWLLTR